MTRTNLPPAPLAPNDYSATPAGLTINSTLVANGAAITGADFERTVLRVTNTASSSGTVTVRAGDSTAAWMAGQGDLTAPVAANGETFIGPFSETRFQQSGGRLHVDFSTGLTGTITALRLPHRM
ncbi:hypothetical protein [Streptomyces sp. NPDC093260]|uniref:hypothetical protein n=1 Tax=Streptomyces sp. NPDC093260 TaxID=3155073 RepID=UPI00342CB128